MFYQVTGTLTSINAHITRNFYAESPEEAGKLATQEGIAVDSVTLIEASPRRHLLAPAASEEQVVSSNLQLVSTLMKWLGAFLIAWSLFLIVPGILGPNDAGKIFASFAQCFIAGLLTLLVALILRALGILVRNSEHPTRPTAPQK